MIGFTLGFYLFLFTVMIGIGIWFLRNKDEQFQRGIQLFGVLIILASGLGTWLMLSSWFN